MEKNVIDAMKKYNLMNQEDQNFKEIEVYEEEEDICDMTETRNIQHIGLQSTSKSY